jgi:hypothetical protein
MHAPVALFVYNRPEHTRRTIESLSQNIGASETPLIIFSDAPRNEDSREKVEEVRRYVRSVSGFKSVEILERSRNYGLANSIIDGVSTVCNRFGQVIVLEDDMLTSKYFLQYMNDGLTTYLDDDRVSSIHGYIYPLVQALPETFFLRGADCWGWATWARAWRIFNPDGVYLLNQLRQHRLSSQFDYNGAYPYTRMLKNQIKGKNDSWAIRWYASAFLAGKYTLYAGNSLIKNIGFDGSGAHCAPTDEFEVAVSDQSVKISKIEVVEDRSVHALISSFHRKSRWSARKRWFKRIFW